MMKIICFCLLIYICFYSLPNHIMIIITRVGIVLFDLYMTAMVIIFSTENLLLFRFFITIFGVEDLNNLVYFFKHKIWMYSIFGLIMVLYYASNISEQLYFIVKNTTGRDEVLMDGTESLIFLGIYSIIIALFHPYFFKRTITLSRILLQLVSSCI